MSRNGSSNSPVIPSLLNSSSSSPIRSTDDDVDGNAVATAANLRTSSDVSLNESSRVISSTRPLGKVISRTNSPKFLQDLGHDYSRYPSSTDVSLGSRTHLATTEVTRHFRDVENGIRSQRNSEKCGYPDDSLGASDPYSYYGGDKGFILYPNEIEEDDSLHLPADNDDITFKPKVKDYFNRRTISSTCGRIVLILDRLRHGFWGFSKNPPIGAHEFFGIYELSTKETIHFVTAANGYLQLRLERFPNHDLDFRSGTLHSWSQLCFKGGTIEVSASMAGPAGNLGCPGYLATTDGVWPYTYNSCDAGIIPNQSSPYGMSMLPGQKLNSYTCKCSDHPNPGTGRGTPEIDILEGSIYGETGIVTQSNQLAPFDITITTLNNSWYDGLAYQKYAYKYIPGTTNSKIAWFVGDDPSFIMDGRAVGPNGNIKARQVAEEPMSIDSESGDEQYMDQD
ncbi:uncharacterized protein RAG0_11995 [Rhynchosporium agropyri]|uniref:GH16 domain-containing protein n=1 Tax=Rhynchosporium agropyri TaxID=914238 RepID=A0A1E1L6Q8_9HELO|nr:uncharacterized protein RAG0_11995 [Rhynchosporium agropyri]